MKKNKDISFVSKEMKKSKNINDDTKKIISFIIVLIVVALAFGGLYILQNSVVSKKLNQETTTAVTYQEQNIIVPEMFNKKGSFKVILIDTKDDLQMVKYQSAISKYSNTDTKLYIVDLNDGMNAKYLNKEKDVNTSVKEFNVNGTTLLTFKDGKVKSIETKEEKILNGLK